MPSDRDIAIFECDQYGWTQRTGFTDASIEDAIEYAKRQKFVAWAIINRNGDKLFMSLIR